MAARLGIYWLKLAIIIVLPTGLILLDSHLFHLRGGEAFGYLALLFNRLGNIWDLPDRICLQGACPRPSHRR